MLYYECYLKSGYKQSVFAIVSLAGCKAYFDLNVIDLCRRIRRSLFVYIYTVYQPNERIPGSGRSSRTEKHSCENASTILKTRPVFNEIICKRTTRINAFGSFDFTFVLVLKISLALRSFDGGYTS